MKFLSVSQDDRSILDAISQIYLNGDWYDLDPTYSQGLIYRDINGDSKPPKHKTDINPLTPDTDARDCRDLKFKDNIFKSIVFDPPFLFRNDFTKQNGEPKPQNKDKMCKRFSYFQTFEDLINMYISSVQEFNNVLIDRGFLIFKCQDFTDGSGTRPFYDTHCKVIQIARANGFSLQDISLLVKTNKLMQNGKQGCFRKVHCYYLVFRKEQRSLKYMETLTRCDDIILKTTDL